MHYAISVFHQDGEKRAKLTLVTPKYEFALVLPYGDLRTSEGRELIWAWAVGIFTIPASALPLELVDRVELVDRLFECLDQSYPVKDAAFNETRREEGGRATARDSGAKTDDGLVRLVRRVF